VTVVPLLLTALLVTVGAANNSPRFGARMSRDVTARKRRPSTPVFQFTPAFHVFTLPEVL
jgi:hypothetical protein